ncbi:MAG: hypothetical protein CL693_22070 [Cellvibrionaceae bacterium]|nr:hypothetical protein [Cellvibrionaceae bacterium]|tara:strand:+ start:2566 stop:3450 length:885 start_codon:yes stop_codon:yes gene_type:complete
MARPGITFDQVAAEAERQRAAGATPTIEKIRAAIGGSPNTVHKHLKVWKGVNPEGERKAPELPPALQAAIVAELQKQADEASAGSREEKISIEADLDQLSAENEMLEADIEEARERSVVVDSENQRLAAQLAERGSEIERLSDSLTQERTAAESVRADLARAEAHLETLQGDLAQARAAVELQLKAAREADNGRLEALQAVAVEKTRREALEVSVGELKTSIVDQKSDFEKRLQAEKADFEKALDAQSEVTIEQVARLEKSLAAAEKREFGLNSQVEKLTEKLTEIPRKQKNDR